MQGSGKSLVLLFCLSEFFNSQPFFLAMYLPASVKNNFGTQYLLPVKAYNHHFSSEVCVSGWRGKAIHL